MHHRQYCIKGYIKGPDSGFKNGTPCYLVGSEGNNDLRYRYLGIIKNGRSAFRWMKTARFRIFEPVEVPLYVRKRVQDNITFCGTLDEMREIASSLNKLLTNVK